MKKEKTNTIQCKLYFRTHLLNPIFIYTFSVHRCTAIEFVPFSLATRTNVIHQANTFGVRHRRKHILLAFIIFICNFSFFPSSLSFYFISTDLSCVFFDWQKTKFHFLLHFGVSGKYSDCCWFKIKLAHTNAQERKQAHHSTTLTDMRDRQKKKTEIKTESNKRNIETSAIEKVNVLNKQSWATETMLKKTMLFIFRQIIFFERKSAFYLLFYKGLSYGRWKNAFHPIFIHGKERRKKKRTEINDDNSSNSNSRKANNSKDYILFGFIYLISSACFYASTECHWFNVGLIVFWQCAVSITFYYLFRVLKMNQKTKQKDTAKFSSYHTRTDEHKTMHGRSTQTTTQRIFRLLLWFLTTWDSSLYCNLRLGWNERRP